MYWTNSGMLHILPLQNVEKDKKVGEDEPQAYS